MTQRAFCEEEVKKNPGLWQKVKDVFKKIVNDIKKKLEMLAKKDLVVKAAMEADLRDVQEAYSIFDSVLRYVQEHGEETENKKAAEEAEKMSLVLIPSESEMKDNMKTVSEMKNVATLTGNEFKKGPIDLITQVENFFDSLGNKVSTEYGDVILNRTGAKSSLGHGMGRMKAVAFTAVPDVLKKGKVIDYQYNWKKRGYDTAVFAAPIKIGTVDYYAGVVVKVSPDENSYYVHELILQKKDNAPFKTGTVKNGTPGEASSPLFSLLKKVRDVKYNSEYFEAIERGDMETVQRMVDEAAKAAGYTMPLYHGAKKGGGFTVFKDWQYFTENKAYAERYMKRDDPSSFYSVYVKADRMFDTRDPECRKIFEQYRREYGLGEILKSGLPDWTDGYDLSDIIEENDLPYDGIVLDEGGDMTENGPVSRGPSYVIRKSNQVKSAEAVTYDDDGNVIPLSERFNPEKTDIRYSRVLGADEADGITVSSQMEYNYDALIRKPDMKVTRYLSSVLTDRDDVIDSAVSNVKKNGNESEKGIASFFVKNTGKEVVVSKHSITHGLDRRIKVMNRVMPQIGEILQNSVRINGFAPKIKTAAGSYVLIGAAEDEFGNRDIVRFVVNSFSNDLEDVDILYAVHKKTESAAFLQKSTAKAAPPTDSFISIADLLESVKNNFPDVLPMDVLKHFGIIERPAGNLGERAKFSRILGAEAAEYVQKVKIENSINRERLNMLQDIAEDLGVFDADSEQVPLWKLKSIVRKYALSGNEPNADSFTAKLAVIRNSMSGSDRIDSALYALYEIAKEEALGMGEWVDVDDGTARDFKKWIRGQSIFVAEEDLNEIAENYGGRAALRRATFGKFNLTPNKEKGKAGGLDAFWDELLEQNFGFTETTDNSERVRQMLEMWGRDDKVWVYDSDAINAGETLEETANDYAERRNPKKTLLKKEMTGRNACSKERWRGAEPTPNTCGAQNRFAAWSAARF